MRSENHSTTTEVMLDVICDKAPLYEIPGLTGPSS